VIVVDHCNEFLSIVPQPVKKVGGFSFIADCVPSSECPIRVLNHWVQKKKSMLHGIPHRGFHVSSEKEISCYWILKEFDRSDLRL
jgi:hypothetical protein